MDPRASIDDVAREAGVSVASVSRALRDLPSVAPATRNRVRLTAQEAFGLTTMRQPVRHMGRIAAAALLAHMGEVEAELPSHVVDVALINRSSTAPLG